MNDNITKSTTNIKDASTPKLKLAAETSNKFGIVHRTNNISWFCHDNISLLNMSSPCFIYIICTAAVQL